MIGLVAGIGLIVVAAGALTVRYVPIPGHRTLVAVIASPFLGLAAPIALVVLFWGRHWVVAGVAGALTAAVVAVQLQPRYVSTTPTKDAIAVRIMTVNVLGGRADPHAVTRLATASADIVMLQELTPKAVKRLNAAGMGEAFPHQATDPRPRGAGTAVFSRYPVIDRRNVKGLRLSLITAQLRVNGFRVPLRVASVHLESPWPQPIDGWHSDLADISAILAKLAQQAGPAPIIVAGDFNATIDMKPFRQLLTHGYRDSATQFGVGRQFTYPANKRYPPLIGIDHVLIRNATAVNTRTVKVPGTDHRAVLVKVMVPTG